MKKTLEKELGWPVQESKPNPEFGKIWQGAVHIDRGPTMDVAFDKERLLAVAIGGGALSIYDARNPKAVRMLGELRGLGNLRKLVLSGTTAFAAAREDGVYVVDLSVPEMPTLLAEYDAIELASGVSVQGDLMAIACRHFGAELVDVSDPKHPRHLSTAYAGCETQSVCIEGDRLYGGAWYSSEVHLSDLSDPREPKPLGRVSLDGYGDGVEAHGPILFAATGHHDRRYRGHHFDKTNADEPGFGGGHGIEIFDVRDPVRPIKLGGLKTPRFYAGVPDLWSVHVSGTRGVLADTHNGVFLIDISDLKNPRFISQWRLPEGRWFEGNLGPDACLGAAPIDGGCFVAGYQTGLYFLPEPSLKTVNLGKKVKPSAAVYTPGGKVGDLADLGEGFVAVAAGVSGLQVIHCQDGIRCVAKHRTRGGVKAISRRDAFLYVAEGREGLSQWGIRPNGELVFLSRMNVGPHSVDHIFAEPSGRYLLTQEGIYLFSILDLSSWPEPQKVLQTKGPGFFSGPQISAELFEDRYACVFWHMGGPYWYDLQKSPPVLTFGFEQNDQTGLIRQGVARWKDRALVSAYDGLKWSHPNDHRPLCQIPPIAIQNAPGFVGGIPTVLGDEVWVSENRRPVIHHLSLADPDRPLYLSQIATRGNPGKIIKTADGILVADGYGGVRLVPGDRLNSV